MDVKEALLKADTYLCGDAPPCYSEQVAVTLAAEVRRLQTLLQLHGEYGCDDKAMYNDPRYPHDEPPEGA